MHGWLTERERERERDLDRDEDKIWSYLAL